MVRTKPGSIQRRSIMQDILWIVVTIVFFVTAIAYVQFCERLK